MTPRAGSIEVVAVAGNTAYRMSPAGVEQLKVMAQVGTPIKAMAEFFGVSDDWMRAAIEGDPLVRDAYHGAKGTGELELRQAAHASALAGDSRVLTFMMERRLKMNKEVEVTHNHNLKVIGAVPDYKLSADEWHRRFAPKLEGPKGDDADEAEDAEFSEVTTTGDVGEQRHDGDADPA
jgi:hypothetical protein